jgi:tetratricopeptide (TPR) repeat protein
MWFRKWHYIALGAIFLFFITLIGYKYIFSAAPKNDSWLSPTVVGPSKDGEQGWVSLTSNQILSLFDMYMRSWDIDVAKGLLQYYVEVGNYNSWYQLILEMRKKWDLTKISESMVAYGLFNYAIQNAIHRDDISSDKDRWLSRDSIDIYNTLSLLTKSDYSWFNAQLAQQEMTNVLYKNFIVALRSSKKWFELLKDPPAYYEAGLTAATLMEAGYLPLAALIAKWILATDKKYILSYEILSQAALKQRQYDDALKYLHILFTLDSQNISRTAFFLWKAYFWKQDYSKALVYLNQVREEKYLYDAVRYMILSYHSQKSYDKMMDGFRYLLAEQKLTDADYLLLFDVVFFEPYTNHSSWDALLSEKYALKVVIPYIDSCRKHLAKTNPAVCKYGEAGWYLVQNKPEKAVTDLLYLTRIYPHPTVYKALGDYYSRVWDTQKAQNYFMKSLISSADTYQNAGILSWNKLTK